jgi:DNA polymerase III subunit beta
MKLTIEKNALVAGLAKISGIVESATRSLYWVTLRSRLMKKASQSAQLILILRRQLRFEANVIEHGQGTVPADAFFNTVKKFAAGKIITMEDGKGRLQVTSGKTKIDFATLQYEDFPAIQKEDYTAKFTMQSDDLLRILNKTSFAMSTEETRYYLNGVYFHQKDGNIVAVSTDGHRLAKAWIDQTDDFPGVIIPAKTVAELRKILTMGAVELSVSANKIMIDIGDTVIQSKVIDGTFPDYSRVIPKGLTETFRADAVAFKTSAGLVATVSDDKVKTIAMAISDGAVAMSVGGGMHLAEDEIEAYIQGGDAKIYITSKYLVEALNQADGGDVDFYYNSAEPLSPCMICPTEDTRFVAVVMPQRG